MSIGDPITRASAEPIQRTIDALAARNVAAVLLQSYDWLGGDVNEFVGAQGGAPPNTIIGRVQFTRRRMGICS